MQVSVHYLEGSIRMHASDDVRIHVKEKCTVLFGRDVIDVMAQWMASRVGQPDAMIFAVR